MFGGVIVMLFWFGWEGSEVEGKTGVEAAVQSGLGAICLKICRIERLCHCREVLHRIDVVVEPPADVTCCLPLWLGAGIQAHTPPPPVIHSQRRIFSSLPQSSLSN